MIDLDSVFALVDRFDVPALGMFTWLWLRANRHATNTAMARQQAAFIEAIGTIKTEMGVIGANLQTQTHAFVRHVDQDRDDNKGMRETVDNRCAEIFIRLNAMGDEIHKLRRVNNA